MRVSGLAESVSPCRALAKPHNEQHFSWSRVPLWHRDVNEKCRFRASIGKGLGFRVFISTLNPKPLHPNTLKPKSLNLNPRVMN